MRLGHDLHDAGGHLLPLAPHQAQLPAEAAVAAPHARQLGARQPQPAAAGVSCSTLAALEVTD